MWYASSWSNTRTNSVGFLCDVHYSYSGIILLRELPENVSAPWLWSFCSYWQNPHGKRVSDWLKVHLGQLACGVNASGSDTMNGHTDAGSRTAWQQTGSEGGSGVGVVSPVPEPGFLALAPAMYRRTYLELGALLTASSCARGHARQVLWEWGLTKLVETSEAVVSELVTNAVETTVRHQLGTPVALRLSSNGRQVLIEVWDADPTPPRLPTLDAVNLPPADAESGRGLFLVASLSERWSCYTLGRGGKVMWAEVSS
jgi:anti-sigma regulatory factor (Ser/Thr protein kinase)